MTTGHPADGNARNVVLVIRGQVIRLLEGVQKAADIRGVLPKAEMGMVICVKCLKEQSRKSGSKCEYDGSKDAEPEHNWMDREEFIAELREKLPPVIRERIAQLRQKLARNLALFNERQASHRKRLDEEQAAYNKVQAAYNAYLKEGLRRDAEKEKQREIRSRLPTVIGTAIGVVISILLVIKFGLPLILWIFGLKISTPFIILGNIVIAGVIVFFSLRSEPVVEFLNVRRYTESQEFADQIARNWRYENGLDESLEAAKGKIQAVKGKIKDEELNWKNISEDIELRINSAERALVESGEELLKFYKKDKFTRHWYVEKIAEWY